MSDDDLLTRALRLVNLWQTVYGRPCCCTETLRCLHCQTRDLFRDAARSGEWPATQQRGDVA